MTKPKIHLYGPVGDKTLCGRDQKTTTFQSAASPALATCLICRKVHAHNVEWFRPKEIRNPVSYTGIKLFDDVTFPAVVVYEKDGYEVLYEPNSGNVRTMCEAHLFDYDEVMRVLINRAPGVHTVMIDGDVLRKHCETLRDG